MRRFSYFQLIRQDCCQECQLVTIDRSCFVRSCVTILMLLQYIFIFEEEQLISSNVNAWTNTCTCSSVQWCSKHLYNTFVWWLSNRNTCDFFFARQIKCSIIIVLVDLFSHSNRLTVTIKINYQNKYGSGLAQQKNNIICLAKLC